jgi:hypothetical protein
MVLTRLDLGWGRSTVAISIEEQYTNNKMKDETHAGVCSTTSIKGINEEMQEEYPLVYTS